jgi:hypothetical protein
MRGARVLATLAIALFCGCTLSPSAALAAKGTNGWYWPLGTESTGGYLGWMGYNSAAYPYHLAQDFAGYTGQPVYSVSAGVVQEARTNVGGYGPGYTAGGAIVILHQTSTGTQFMALYGHLSSLQVANGQSVAAGQVIGYLNAFSPPHVHFGIHLGASYPPDGNPWRGYTSSASNTYGFVNPVAFLNSNAAPGGAPLSPYAGTTRAVTPWIASYSADCGNALDVGQGGSGPIKFTMVPGHFVGGIVVSKMFDNPVDKFSFHYTQNLHNAWMSFQVFATDAAGNRRVVNAIDRYGGYAEDVTLTGLNAKKIEVVIWTRKVGDLGAGNVANWYAELSNISFSSAGWSYLYSNDCGSGLDVGSSQAVPISFAQRPGHFVGGIIAWREFATPVDTFSFHYTQNWHNAWMIFSVVVTDPAGNRRTVKVIDRYGGYAEDVTLTGLNAKKIEVVIWTKQVGDLGAGAVANWYCSLSNVSLSSDSVPPHTTSDRVACYASSATIHLTATDNAGGSGVAHTYYTVNGLPQTEGTTVDVGGANTYTLTYWSVDAAGNVESPHTVTFSIIVPPPVGGAPSTPTAPLSVKHGTSFTTLGYVSKHTAGTYPVTLRFYRYKSGKHVYYKSVSAKASSVLSFSKYARSTSVPYAGKWRVRAVHKVGTRYFYSGYRYFTAN